MTRNLSVMQNTDATEKQIAFMNRLMDTIESKTAGILTQDALGARGANDMIRTRLSSGNPITKLQASQLIETLIKASNINYGTPTPNASTPAPRTPAPLGIYRVDGEIYCVRKARQSDRVYAYKLINIEGRDPRWEYAAGKVFDLKVEQMITVEQAMEFGRMTGICCICGRLLTDEDSVRKGIGPICGNKYSATYLQAIGA